MAKKTTTAPAKEAKTTTAPVEDAKTTTAPAEDAKTTTAPAEDAKTTTAPAEVGVIEVEYDNGEKWHIPLELVKQEATKYGEGDPVAFLNEWSCFSEWEERSDLVTTGRYPVQQEGEWTRAKKTIL